MNRPVPSRNHPQRLTLWCVLVFAAVIFGCGGSSSSPPRLSPPPVATGAVPLFSHVVLIVEENKNYSEVIGNTAMPYLNSLASQYGLATQYFANTHPSIGNYFMLTTGQIISNDDTFVGVVSADNLVRQLLAAGKTWKSYAENRGDPLLYAKWHDPFSYFSEVVNDSAQVQNLTTLTQFKSDLANGKLPNFSFVLPNLLDDAHSAPVENADLWLQQNIGPLIADPNFQKSGLLIIVFDEANSSDTTNGGGHVPALIISSQARQGFQSTKTYQHQNILRLMLQALGVQNFPAAAAMAGDMGEFF
jgi:phosphatidylinositol-3-phosphatase